MASKTFASFLMLLSYVGVLLVEVFTNRPQLFVPNPLSGRACPALFLYKFSSHWLYYTTYGACTLSWSFAVVLFASAAYLAVKKFWPT